jgi:hypothetical protein
MGSRICAVCVHEPFLARLANASAVTDQECDFCNRVRGTLNTDEVLDRCEKILQDYYQPTSLSDDVLVRGEEPDGEPLRQVLEELLGANDEVTEELVDGLSNRWFDSSSHESLYGDDPYFVERSRQTSMYGVDWHHMERSLRTEARLVNPQVTQTLERVFGPIQQHQTWDGDDVIVEVGPGTEIETVFRARVFQELETLERALYYPAREIGPPPAGIGRAGRMNAQGVSVFYGATKPAVAIAEVRPPVGSHVVVGSFQITRRLRILDLDKLEHVVIDRNASYFDPNTREIVERNGFLRSLTRRLVMPVMPEHESSGYLVTQAVADFLSTHPHLSVDGILFKSIQHDGSSEDAGRNLVLFNKASRVEGTERGTVSVVQDVSLFDYDEDGDYFYPRVTLKKPEDIKPIDPLEIEPDSREVTLKMDLDQLNVSKVKGAEYRTDDTRVRTWKPSS